MSLYCKPSARPREISSRSTNINISRTTGILSHRTFKIKCYDWLSPGWLAAAEGALIYSPRVIVRPAGMTLSANPPMSWMSIVVSL
jgi:hypothetical protein